jgi:hypothetical protein
VPGLFGRIQIFRKHKTDQHHDRKRHDEQHDQAVSIFCVHLQIIQVTLPMRPGSIWNSGYEGEALLPDEFVPWVLCDKEIFCAVASSGSGRRVWEANNLANWAG